MIGRLRGTLLENQPPFLVVEAHGVGYEVEVPLSILGELPRLGAPLELFTHFVVREDAQLLYGFPTRTERDMFRQLIKVTGVGPKLGMAILSHMSVTELVLCVRDDNVTRLTKMPGVGKKTAERLIIDLRDRLRHWGTEEALPLSPQQAMPLPGDAREEAEAALLALGYKPAEASRAIAQVYESGMERDTLLRLVLKGMVKA